MTDFRPQSCLVVGASRGIGLALAEWLIQHPSSPIVHATHRGSEPAEGLSRLSAKANGRLLPHRLDVTEDKELEDLANGLAQEQVSLDLVIHCAGILHEGSMQPEKALNQINRENLRRSFEVNSFGPILLAKAVMPLMPRERSSHFVALSAMVGSIGDNRIGGWYAYRSSKAALNQLMRTLSIETARQKPGLCVTSIHPGTTDTGLSKPFQARVPSGRLYTTQQSAERIMQVVLAGEPGDSGRFVNWDGERLPW